MEKRNRKIATMMSRTIKTGEIAEGEMGDEASTVAVGATDSVSVVVVESMVDISDEVGADVGRMRLEVVYVCE